MEAGVELGSHQVDPKAPLSNLDLAKFLMEDTQKQVAVLKDHLMECMSDDRNHFNEIINLVVSGSNQKIDKLVQCVIQNKEEFSNRVNDLELFVKTVTSYNEHLISSTNNKIHDLVISLESLKEVPSEIDSSNLYQEFHSQHQHMEESNQSVHELALMPQSSFNPNLNTNIEANYSSSHIDSNSSLTSDLVQLDGNDTVDTTMTEPPNVQHQMASQPIVDNVLSQEERKGLLSAE